MIRTNFQINQAKNSQFLVTYVDVCLPNLPDSFSGYRIVQLTDFHFGATTKAPHLEAAVQIAVAQNPDLVVLTGDYVQASASGKRYPFPSNLRPSIAGWVGHRRIVRTLAKALSNILAPLSPPDGILAVLGNHDRVDGTQTIKRSMGNNISWLTNLSVFIEKEGKKLQIAGVDDTLRGKPDLQKSLSFSVAEQSRISSNVRSKTVRTRGASPFFKLLLSHSPDITIDEQFSSDLGINLILSGHTHGGQICLPFLGALLTHTEQRQHTAGLSFRDNTAIYVSNGLGYQYVPIRLFCPPEIPVFTFRKG